MAVAGDRIVGIGPGTPERADVILDAEGCVVSPGFVDIHAHSDQSLFKVPGAESKVSDGVTTELNGNCGLTPFPVAPVEGGHAASARSWRDFAGFADSVESTGSALNRAFLVGHGALRGYVMGAADRPPTRSEARAMKRALAESMDQGAFGLSSGLAYAPGCFARGDELAELTRVVAERGGLYATHIRNEGDGLIESIEEALAAARASGVRLQVSHLKTLGQGNWPKIDQLERVLLEAMSEGLDVAADRYPYLACSTGLRALFSPWLMDGGPERAMERLRDPAARARLREDCDTEFAGKGLWESVMVSAVKGEANAHRVGRRIADMAEEEGKEPLDFALDLLAAAETAVSVLVFAMCEENLDRMLNWPFVMVASDASAKTLAPPPSGGLPHPRSFGTFSRVLGRLVRDRGALALHDAIVKMTSQPAKRMGLRERGEIKEGFYADITVFDPERIEDRSTYDDPWRGSVGVRHVLVNGEPVVRDGELTGARPGRVLRAE